MICPHPKKAVHRTKAGALKARSKRAMRKGGQS